MAEDQLRTVIDGLRTRIQAELDAQLDAVAQTHEQTLEQTRGAPRMPKPSSDGPPKLEAAAREWAARLQAEVAAARTEVERTMVAESMRVRVEAEQAAAEAAARARRERMPKRSSVGRRRSKRCAWSWRRGSSPRWRRRVRKSSAGWSPSRCACGSKRSRRRPNVPRTRAASSNRRCCSSVKSRQGDFEDGAASGPSRRTRGGAPAGADRSRGGAPAGAGELEAEAERQRAKPDVEASASSRRGARAQRARQGTDRRSSASRRARSPIEDARAPARSTVARAVTPPATSGSARRDARDRRCGIVVGGARRRRPRRGARGPARRALHRQRRRAAGMAGPGRSHGPRRTHRAWTDREAGLLGDALRHSEAMTMRRQRRAVGADVCGAAARAASRSRCRSCSAASRWRCSMPTKARTVSRSPSWPELVQILGRHAVGLRGVPDGGADRAGDATDAAAHRRMSRRLNRAR